MIIRDCTVRDIPRCAEIWKDCFPEDKDFCDYYFNNVHPLGKSLVCEACGTVTSYLNILDFDANCKGRLLKSSYIYAVSTHSDFRNKGYMSAIFNRALELCDNKDFTFLIPSVNGIYEKFGFKTIARQKSMQYDISGNDCLICNDISHLNMIYEQFCKRFNLSVVRSYDWWKIIYETAVSDGFSFIANDGAYAVVSDDEIAELAYISEHYRDRLNIKHKTLKLPKVMARGNMDFDNNYIAMMLN